MTGSEITVNLGYKTKFEVILSFEKSHLLKNSLSVYHPLNTYPLLVGAHNVPQVSPDSLVTVPGLHVLPPFELYVKVNSPFQFAYTVKFFSTVEF